MFQVAQPDSLLADSARLDSDTPVMVSSNGLFLMKTCTQE